MAAELARYTNGGHKRIVKFLGRGDLRSSRRKCELVHRQGEDRKVYIGYAKG